jgi:hypothetical protein
MATCARMQCVRHYAPGMTPDPPGYLTLSYHAADADKQEEDLMPAERGDEALEAELHTEALLDEVDVHAAAAYKAGVWHKLCQGGGQGPMGGGPLQRARKRCAGADMDGDGAHSMRLWKWRKGVVSMKRTSHLKRVRRKGRSPSTDTRIQTQAERKSGG